MNWRCGSSGRAAALQVGSSEYYLLPNISMVLRIIPKFLTYLKNASYLCHLKQSSLLCFHCLSFLQYSALLLILLPPEKKFLSVLINVTGGQSIAENRKYLTVMFLL
jgi:hypothetical protein